MKNIVFNYVGLWNNILLLKCEKKLILYQIVYISINYGIWENYNRKEYLDFSYFY